MKSIHWVVLGTLAGLMGLAPEKANAQFRPNPIFNLNRPGGSLGQNYFGLVLPQQQLYGQTAQLQRQQQLLGLGYNNYNAPAELITGVGASFFGTHRGYFLNHIYGGGYGRYVDFVQPDVPGSYFESGARATGAINTPTGNRLPSNLPTGSGGRPLYTPYTPFTPYSTPPGSTPPGIRP